MSLTQPIKWHGGKHYLAKWIISQMPKHTHYVEPYFGGGSVLLQKDPEGVSEVANDVDRNLSCFWNHLADDRRFSEFGRMVESIPFSENDFDASRAELAFGSSRDLHRAVAFFVVARQSRQGLCRDFATLSRNRTRRGMNEQVSSWLTAIEGLPEVHARMKRVVVLNRDALDVIRQQDGPNTLFYLDPPYLHETRKTTSDYSHEMTAEDHCRLLDALAGIEGKFILSGYPSELYYASMAKHGWDFASCRIDNKASSAKIKEKKIECLWANFDLEAQRKENANATKEI